MRGKPAGRVGDRAGAADQAHLTCHSSAWLASDRQVVCAWQCMASPRSELVQDDEMRAHTHTYTHHNTTRHAHGLVPTGWPSLSDQHPGPVPVRQIRRNATQCGGWRRRRFAAGQARDLVVVVQHACKPLQGFPFACICCTILDALSSSHPQSPYQNAPTARCPQQQASYGRSKLKQMLVMSPRPLCGDDFCRGDCRRG